MTSNPAIQDTCTLAEGVLSQLIGRGLIDETNTFALRSYEEKARVELGVDPVSFYTDIYVYDEDSEDDDFSDVENYVGDWSLLDERVAKLIP